MDERTLGDLAAQILRYKAQLFIVVGVVLIAVFLDGKSSEIPGVAAPSAFGTPVRGETGTQDGAAQLAGTSVTDAGLISPRSADIPDLSPAGVNASGTGDSGASSDQGGADEAPAPGPTQAPFTCDNDASLPMPVIAPVMEQLRGALPADVMSYIAGAAMCSPGTDPLTLVVNQLGPALGNAGPVLDVLRTVNSALPPIPVPPAILFPEVPPEFAPVLAGIAPVTSAVCDQLAITVILPAVLASFPLPITSEHYGPALGLIFDACSQLRG